MTNSKKTGKRQLIGIILTIMLMLTGCGTNARQEIDKFRMRFHLVPTSDRETIISDNSPIEDALIQEEYAFEKKIRDTQNSELITKSQFVDILEAMQRTRVGQCQMLRLQLKY